jgi:hypothetical protein
MKAKKSALLIDSSFTPARKTFQPPRRAEPSNVAPATKNPDAWFLRNQVRLKP